LVISYKDFGSERERESSFFLSFRGGVTRADARSTEQSWKEEEEDDDDDDDNIFPARC